LDRGYVKTSTAALYQATGYSSMYTVHKDQHCIVELLALDPKACRTVSKKPAKSCALTEL